MQYLRIITIKWQCSNKVLTSILFKGDPGDIVVDRGCGVHLSDGSTVYSDPSLTGWVKQSNRLDLFFRSDLKNCKILRS